ncbi:hypothetical protein V6N11_077897 [Hibiscus sabdariffa]|uniref:Uncharacterized protein n=1 Tax=Hibiscus sabdariffa TaxID=183260 RepID=A0ABR2TFD7_9ROSI
MLQSAFISFLRRASFFLQIHFSWVQNAVFYTTWFCLKKKKAFQQELINEGRCYRNHFDFHSPSLKQCCRAQAEGISRAMKVMTFVMYLCSVTTLSDDPVQEWILTEGKATQITRVVASILQVAMKLILVLSLSKQLGMLCKVMPKQLGFENRKVLLVTHLHVVTSLWISNHHGHHQQRQSIVVSHVVDEQPPSSYRESSIVSYCSNEWSGLDNMGEISFNDQGNVKGA